MSGHLALVAIANFFFVSVQYFNLGQPENQSVALPLGVASFLKGPSFSKQSPVSEQNTFR